MKKPISGLRSVFDFNCDLDIFISFLPKIQDKTNNKKLIRLPDEIYGQLFIFRIFKNISYGLIMQVTDTVEVGHIAQSPEK